MLRKVDNMDGVMLKCPPTDPMFSIFHRPPPVLPPQHCQSAWLLSAHDSPTALIAPDVLTTALANTQLYNIVINVPEYPKCRGLVSSPSPPHHLQIPLRAHHYSVSSPDVLLRIAFPTVLATGTPGAATQCAQLGGGWYPFHQAALPLFAPRPP
jgi:hypothetical protein